MQPLLLGLGVGLGLGLGLGFGLGLGLGLESRDGTCIEAARELESALITW